MKSKSVYVVLFPVVCLMLLTGCTSFHGTHIAYSSLARSQQMMLESPGYIVGIEKRKRNQNRGFHLTGADADLYQQSQPPQPIFERTTDDFKVPFISHIVTYRDGQARYDLGAFKNPYAKKKKPKLRYPKALPYEELTKALELRLKEEQPSHLFFLACGWNNDQAVSISNYNAWMSNISTKAEQQGMDFRPMVVGITWPSGWGSRKPSIVTRTVGAVISYPVKADDADGIGYTVVNKLLNDVVCSARDAGSPNTKIVCMGHSFGGRILASAVHASEHLKGGQGAQKVDLFIGAQPAFSVKRFSEEAGREKLHYDKDNRSVRHIVITTSKNDPLNPFAQWVTGAKHVGGKPGWTWAQRNGDRHDLLLRSWPDLPPASEQPILMNTTPFVMGHGDVFGPMFAEFVVRLLQWIEV